MGNIDWILIDDIPEDLADGRDLLLWADDRAIVGTATLKKDAYDMVYLICGGRDGQPTYTVTHFAEIDPPRS